MNKVTRHAIQKPSVLETSERWLSENFVGAILYKALKAYGQDKNIQAMAEQLQTQLCHKLGAQFCFWLLDEATEGQKFLTANAWEQTEKATVFQKNKPGLITPLTESTKNGLAHMTIHQFIPVKEIKLPADLKAQLTIKKAEWLFLIPLSLNEDKSSNNCDYLLLTYQHIDDFNKINAAVIQAVEELFSQLSTILKSDAEANVAKQYLRMEKLKADVLNAIGQSFNTNHILKSVANRLLGPLNIHRCIFLQLDTTQTDLPVKQVNAFSLHEEEIELSIDMFTPEMIMDSLMGQLTYPEQPHRPLGNQWDEFFKHTNTGCAYGFQIMYRGIPLGLMIVQQCKTPQGFTEEALMMLQSVSVNLGAAIYQNLLFKQEKEAQQQVEQESRRKNQYIASLSHELRSPLNNMVTCSAMMKDGLLGALEPKQHQYIELINTSAYHLLDMINDLLDISKIESGKFQLVKTQFDFKAIVNDLYLMMVPSLVKKNQQFHLNISEGFPEQFYGDCNRLRQVLSNLLANAHKFSPESTTIDLRGDIESRNSEQWLVLMVSDEGPGISKADLDIIFEPFEQASRTEFVHHKGTGLGLSISKNIVALHGGQITVQSEEGQGSTFTVALPFKAD